MFSVYSDAHTVNEPVGFLGRIGESWDLIKRGTKSCIIFPEVPCHYLISCVKSKNGRVSDHVSPQIITVNMRAEGLVFGLLLGISILHDHG